MLAHGPQIVFGVLIVILCGDQVACHGFGAGEGQVMLIFHARVLRNSRIVPAEPGSSFISERGSRHGVDRHFRIRVRLRCDWPRSRRGFHVGPYAAGRCHGGVDFFGMLSDAIIKRRVLQESDRTFDGCAVNGSALNSSVPASPPRQASHRDTQRRFQVGG